MEQIKTIVIEKDNNYNEEIIKLKEEDKLINNNNFKNNNNIVNLKLNKKINYISTWNYFWFKFCVAFITCLSTTLDGYLLILIGYNKTILNKEWNLNENYLIFLEIFFHINGALGGIFSIPTCHYSNRIGLNYNFYLSLLTIPFLILLFYYDNYFIFLISTGIICFTNGHLYNIGTNLIINKFSPNSRGSIFALIFFCNQFGKLLFSYFIYKYNDIIQIGIINVTLVPIILLFLLEIFVNFSMIILYYERDKYYNLIQKEKDENYLIYIFQIFKKINFYKKKKDPFSMYDYLFKDIENIFMESPELHEIIMDVINFSLGVQFYGMINVFPLLKKPVPTLIKDEIFFSKVFHTILLGIFTLIFVTYTLNAMICLYITFVINLILNLSIIFNWFDSYWIIHLFRLIWNISYVMSNIYCAEAILKKNRGTNTSFLYLIFKFSCIFQMIFVDKIIEKSLFLPIALNIFTLLFDIIIISKLKINTYLVNTKDIDIQINNILLLEKHKKKNGYI